MAAMGFARGRLSPAVGSRLATARSPPARRASTGTSAGAASNQEHLEEPLRRFFFGDIFREGQYEPLHPELFEPAAAQRLGASWFAPSFAELVAAARRGEPCPSLKEEAPGVYSFPLFKPEFCDLLLEEVEHAQRTKRDELQRPNGMNRYGIVLNQLGLEPLISSMQQEHLLPLQHALYPEAGSQADDHHCFIVRYRAGEDVGLDMHEDDSDVTLNVCLGKTFTAATLSFCGLASEKDHRKLAHTYQHEKGRAVVHLGRHRHGADDIQSGERVNMILWTVNHKYRASEEFKRQRTRNSNSDEPDKICLSYTHDQDYTAYLPKPTREQAIAHGVMLDVVQRRQALRERPVQDLARPLEEINTVPSVCLFLEGLPPQQQHALFKDYMNLAIEVIASFDIPAEDSSPPPLIFFVAVQPQGAAPQVRKLCGVQGSPALAVLDIEAESCYPLESDKQVDADAIRAFVHDFMAGKLTATKLSSASPATKA